MERLLRRRESVARVQTMVWRAVTALVLAGAAALMLLPPG